MPAPDFHGAASGRALITASSGHCCADVVIGICGIRAQVIEVDAPARRLVVSERHAARKQRLQALQPGQVWEGTVAALTDYGAFVDLLTPEGQPRHPWLAQSLTVYSSAPTVDISGFTVDDAQAVLAYHQGWV